MKRAFFILALFCVSLCQAQKTEEKLIRNLLLHQTQAWNRGDIEGFMQTYWQSDSLMFVGKSGVTRGWKNTLEHYKQGYPDKDAMGQLSFDIIKIKKLSKDYFFVIGKWMLQRKIGDLSGHYTLLIKKINGQWKIVTDHSS
jgi:ketosteroid isomerase-like protein